MKFIEVKAGKIVGVVSVDAEMTPKDVESAIERGLAPVPDDLPIERLTHSLVDEGRLASALAAYAQSKDLAVLQAAVVATVGEKEVVALRVINRGAFMDRFSIEAQLALEEIAEGQTPEGRLVRVFTRRLDAEAQVDLDAPRLTSALAQIKDILQQAGVHGWATKEAADASVAAILA